MRLFAVTAGWAWQIVAAGYRHDRDLRPETAVVTAHFAAIGHFADFAHGSKRRRGQIVHIVAAARWTLTKSRPFDAIPGMFEVDHRVARAWLCSAAPPAVIW